MIEAEFTYFDLAVLGILGLSCLFAFFRGFVKEILSLGAWIGAGIVTLYFFRDVAELIKPHVKSDMVSGGLAALGLYVSTLILFSIFNSLIMRMVKDGGDVGILDNALGLVFGALRGAFVVSLGYFMLSTVVNENNEPDWLKNAHTKQYAEQGAIILGKAAPDYLVDITSLKDKIVDERGVLDTDVQGLFSGSDSVDEVELQQLKRDEDAFNQIINPDER